MVSADDIYNGNPSEPLTFATDPQFAAIVDTVAEELTSIETDIAAERDNLFIETADEDALEAFGRAINTPRRTNESLEKYRTRVTVAYAAAISEGTIKQLASIATRVLDTPPSRIEIRRPESREEPVVILEVQNSVLEATPFDAATISSLLKKTIPAGHDIEVDTYGTLRLDGPDYTPPDGSGLGEGTLGGRIE